MNFLVQTPHAWRGIHQRPHHLMKRFADAGEHVVWIEPRYLRWLLRRRSDFFRARNESPCPRLHVRPVTLVNGERFGPLRRFNQARIARAMVEPLTELPPEPTILWIYNPHEVHLADTVPHQLLVYDIMDEYRGFPWSPARIAEEEAELLERADWVFTGTRALYEAKQARAPGRVECELSGVETDFFATSDGPPPPPLDRIVPRHRHVAGYAGMIDMRVDQDLILAAAAGLPEWAFVLIGPVVVDVSRLSAQPNVYLTGPQPYTALPACYRTFDVALLPFIESDLTRHINPTKMLEYAAAGRPIVARGLPEIVHFYARGAWLYETTPECIAHLRSISNAPFEALAPKLEVARTWSAERSWDAIADRMLQRVTGLLDQRTPTTERCT